MRELDKAVQAVLRRQLSAEAAALFAPRMLHWRREAGAFIVQAGGKAHGLFLLVEGELDVFVGEGENMLRVGTIHQGTFFGEAGFFDRCSSSATIRAATDASVAELALVDFEELADVHPREATELLRLLTGLLGARVGETNTQLLARSGDSPSSGLFSRVWGRLFGGAR